MCDLWEKIKMKLSGNNEGDSCASGTSGTHSSSGLGGKYALIVGINKYANSNNTLSGCVNDAMNMRTLLIDKFGFQADNIRMLTDKRATKNKILQRLKWLVSKHGELVYHHSGHGSQIRDRNGDELNDGLDEILIPYDHDWDHPLTDDMIANIFATKYSDSYLTMICDTCHSGSMNRDFNSYGSITDSHYVRFLSPPADIMVRSFDRDIEKNTFSAKVAVEKDNVLISGCKDNQSSMDAYINGSYQGVMTSALIKAANEFERPTWNELYAKMISIINIWKYEQDPQLTGSEALKNRPVFGG